MPPIPGPEDSQETQTSKRLSQARRRVRNVASEHAAPLELGEDGFPGVGDGKSGGGGGEGGGVEEGVVLEEEGIEGTESSPGFEAEAGDGVAAGLHCGEDFRNVEEEGVVGAAQVTAANDGADDAVLLAAPIEGVVRLGETDDAEAGVRWLAAFVVQGGPKAEMEASRDTQVHEMDGGGTGGGGLDGKEWGEAAWLTGEWREVSEEGGVVETFARDAAARK